MAPARQDTMICNLKDYIQCSERPRRPVLLPTRPTLLSKTRSQPLFECAHDVARISVDISVSFGVKDTNDSNHPFIVHRLIGTYHQKVQIQDAL